MYFKSLVAAALFMGASLAQAFAPQAGTWVVNSELDGKPGRGLAIDVQNNTLVMQMYGYESSGQPTFYMATATEPNHQVAAPLNRDTGGRHLGSGPRSGVEAGSMGLVKFRFTSGIAGFITLPGESEQAISRFNFGYPTAPGSLVGIWSFTSIGTEGLIADAVQLTKNLGPSTTTGNGLVVTDNSQFGCEHQVSGNLAGSVVCVKINAQGTLLRSYLMFYSVNEGEGVSRLSNTGTEQMLSVRRLTTPQGVGTGIVYKSDEATSEHPALRAHLNDIVATANAQ